MEQKVSGDGAMGGLGTRVSRMVGASTQVFERDGAHVTAPMLSDGLNSYTPGISVSDGSGTSFQHSGLKNIVAQSDASGSLAASRIYDAFGNLLGASGSWRGSLGYGGVFGYQQGGAGFQPTHGSLKLLGHRYYDSSTGRFLTRDPIKDGRNWYVYCESDPVNYVDPDGLAKRPGWTLNKNFNFLKAAQDGNWEMVALILELKIGELLPSDVIDVLKGLRPRKGQLKLTPTTAWRGKGHAAQVANHIDKIMGRTPARVTPGLRKKWLEEIETFINNIHKDINRRR